MVIISIVIFIISKITIIVITKMINGVSLNSRSRSLPNRDNKHPL